MKSYVWFIVIAVLFVVGLSSVFWIFGVYNTEVALRNRYLAQYKIRETTMDSMIKTLKNQNKVVTDSYAKNFIAVVVAQSEGRKGGSGGNFVSAKFVKESEKLGIPSEMFAQLSNSIAGKLGEYKRSQNMLTDIWREHNTYCMSMPYSFLIGDRAALCKEPQMITSAEVQEGIATGKLDNNLL